MNQNSPGRRKFIKQGLIGSSSVFLPSTLIAQNNNGDQPEEIAISSAFYISDAYALDLSPAKWIWFPSRRTLPNTFILFRKEIVLKAAPAKASGWILGDSRYRFHCNERRIQWGPAPSDPRWSEADPVNLTEHLKAGKNIIGAEVLYYGFGDGTWPIGKPGFIFKLDLEYSDGTSQSIISDESWLTYVADAWRPGQYKRWYLRSLQEEFDARLYPHDWLKDSYQTRNWLAASVIPGSRPDKPVIASYAADYLNDSGGDIPEAQLRKRSIGMMRESFVPVYKLSEQMRLNWKIDPDNYFRFVTPEKESFEVIREEFAVQNNNSWSFEVKETSAALLTFELEEQHVGFPYFTIEASEGTIVELLVHEGHAVNSRHTIINTHFNSWSRFICKEGINQFEEFDYESLRWLQFHIRNAKGTVRLSNIGMRRRVYAYENIPSFRCGDMKLEKLFDACVNTVYNQSQETIVDGMARERQQYSGDLGHIVHALANGFGEFDLITRFCNTYSQGLTKAGYFLDTWPAYDRLARLVQREIGMTNWGPLIDHGVGFNFDCYYYYLYTGDTKALNEVYPRLKRFFNYLTTLKNADGTMPVEDIGIPVVWIDHIAYKKQKHKECAFSLYVAAMCLHALPALAKAFNENSFAEKVKAFGKSVLNSTTRKFWSAAKSGFICNLPWAKQEGEERLCDRSLATAILFDMAPGTNYSVMGKILADKPKELGISYPTNAVWRYWALAKMKRIDILLNEFRTEWYNSPSVQLNNTLSEFLDIQPDTSAQWSHASIAPMFCAYMSIAGISPLKPGLTEVSIAPQMGDLEILSIKNFTVKGAIILDLKRNGRQIRGTITIPEGVSGKFTWQNRDYPLRAGKQEIVSG